MTPEQIIEMAKQAGFDTLKGRIYPYAGEGDISKKIQAFVQLVRNATLEEAAKHCQDCSSPPQGETQTDGQFAALHLSQQIRGLKV